MSYSADSHWQRIYEEEKKKLEEFFRTSSESGHLQKTNATKNDCLSQSDHVRKKQFIIDSLLQMRGRVQLKHEQSLKKQQEALIMTIDNSIKKEAKERKEHFFKAAEDYVTSKFLEELSRALSVAPPAEVFRPSVPSEWFTPTDEDLLVVKGGVDSAMSQIEYILETYVTRKKQRALEAMQAEMMNTTSQNIGLEADIKVDLQENITSLMERASRLEEDYWKVKLSEQIRSKEVSANLQSYLKIHRKNMQLSAQICILRELQATP